MPKRPLKKQTATASKTAAPKKPIILKLPDYLNPNRRSAMGKRNDLAYERKRLEIQAELDLLPLPEALRLLQEQQMDIGFIQDDLSQVKYFQCYGPDEDSFFIGQFNARRAERSRGSGRIMPPFGVETKSTPSTRCFLCTDNVRWQSRGIQLYYQFKVGANVYNALCNPFPFMPTHITIASIEHEPQSWHSTVAWKSDKVYRIVRDLYDVASQLPGFVGFYNGVGAGASIEEHFHYQFFQIPNGHGLFPLQNIANLVETRTKASAMLADENISTLVIDPQNYPLTCFRFRGDRGRTIQAVVERIRKWNTVAGDSASANVTAIWEKDEKDQKSLVIYLIPRNRFFSRSIGMAGVVGGLETLGEFIFCTEEENRLINTQGVHYEYMTSILRGVKPPNVERLNTK